jgi:hypothetical protein
MAAQLRTSDVKLKGTPDGIFYNLQWEAQDAKGPYHAISVQLLQLAAFNNALLATTKKQVVVAAVVPHLATSRKTPGVGVVREEKDGSTVKDYVIGRAPKVPADALSFSASGGVYTAEDLWAHALTGPKRVLLAQTVGPLLALFVILNPNKASKAFAESIQNEVGNMRNKDTLFRGLAATIVHKLSAPPRKSKIKRAAAPPLFGKRAVPVVYHFKPS